MLPITESAVPSRRTYLFLQGPMGAFFRTLGAELRTRGHEVHRINFNGGDVLDWPTGGTHWYRGDLAAWPQWLRSFAGEQLITDLVLFGDCRTLHVEAIRVLRAWRPWLRVHVFEEGYLRPDWITLESGGVNAHSPLMAIRDRYHEQPEVRQALPETQPVGATVVPMGRSATLHYLVMFLLGWLFPRYQHHRQPGAIGELLAWAPRLLLRRRRIRQVAALEHELLASTQPFFLVLLQINCDKQVQVHSPLRSMRELLDRVIPSFAAHAPRDCLLVVKGHPLDNGQCAHESAVQELAAAHGIEDRLVFLDGGELIPLVERCRGAVTINSTAGLSALHRGVPLFCLGETIYDAPGLAHQGSLDGFWTAPQPANRERYLAFRHVVALRSQINGAFYTPRGRELALPAVLERLSGGTPIAGPSLSLPPPASFGSLEEAP